MSTEFTTPMDPLMAEKLKAMKNYKKKRFMNNHFLYFSTVLISGFLCSYTSRLPPLYHCLSTTFSNMRSSLLNPNRLFMLVMVIIALLIVESKFGCSNSSQESDIYDEYVDRSRSRSSRTRGRRAIVQEMKNECQERVGVTKVRETEMGKKHSKEKREDEEDALPTEELNKRAEEFIARVNKQRSLEIRALLGENRKNLYYY